MQEIKSYDKYCPEQFEIVGSAMWWTQSTMSKEWKLSVGYVEDLKSNTGTRDTALFKECRNITEF